jgi:hypothetical protein
MVRERAMMPSATRAPRLWYGLFLPVAAALATGIYIGLAPVFGRAVWGAPRALTLSEAAALGDVGALRRLHRAGASLRARHRVEYGLRRKVPPELTPLEAALLGRNPTVLSTLLDLGAPLEGDAVSPLWCFAREERLSSLLSRIEAAVPAVLETDCARTTLDR